MHRTTKIFLSAALVFLFLFSSSWLWSQKDRRASLQSNPDARKLGLLFREPERDPRGIQGSAFIEALDLEPITADSHYNTAYLPPIDSQGSQGSCVAWAVGYYYKTYQENREDNRTDEAEKSLSANIFSPAFIYNLIHVKNDGGAYFGDAFAVINDFGCPSLEEMPYDDSDYQTYPDEADFENAIPQRTQCSAGDYYYLRMDSDSDLDQVKQLLLDGELAVFGIYVYPNFDSISSYDNTYTVADKTGSSRGGHAQTLVGFDDNKVTNDGTGAFRAVNSWGTGWGDSGYYWISYEAIKYGSGLSQGYALWADDRNSYSSDKKIRFEFSHDYSRETNCWVSVEGVQKDFLDFYVNSNFYEYLSFPQSNIVLDVKDLESYINEGSTLYLYMKDKLSNGSSGIIYDFIYEDSYSGLDLSSYDPPVGVGDTSQGRAAIEIPYSGTPLLECSKDSLYFGADTSDNETEDQDFLVYNEGSGTLNWAVSDNASWLSCSPTSGTGEGAVNVSVDASGLSTGTHTAAITVSDPAASNSPQSVNVTLNVYGAGSLSPPFGVFDTPESGSTVSGNIPVTGWALDDIQVTRVQIKRAAHPDDSDEVIGPDGLVHIGNTVFVKGARPDVEAAYPSYPQSDRAGWGCMILTNFLPDDGNGEYTLYALAYDGHGNKVELGNKTVVCDNASRTKPFGTIDTPARGSVVSGTDYVNFGWALTPQPKHIPEDGSTIWVWLDGVPLGHPDYGHFRPDIASRFPDYANSDGAIGFYYIDTTAYENGVHSIAWSVRDSHDEGDGIGARRFEIQNTGGASSGTAGSQFRYLPVRAGLEIHAERLLRGMRSHLFEDWDRPPSFRGERSDVDETVRFRALSESTALEKDPSEATGIEAAQGADGVKAVRIEIEEVERIEVLFRGTPGCTFMGWGADRTRPLPAGSTLDKEKGVFYWMPLPGFLGRHVLHFSVTDGSSRSHPLKVVVDIVPKEFN